MGSLGGGELILVVLVFVLLFGAKKLPELGSSVGKSIKNFKRGIDDANNDDDDDITSAERVNSESTTRTDQT